jgi:D-xylonolactonase
MKSIKTEIVADFPCITGENPLWHPAEKCVYWTDIPAGVLHRYQPTSARAEAFDMGAQVGGFTIQADGSLLLFMARGAVRLWRNGRFLSTVIDQLPGELDNRFNDVVADPEGRVFCGVMSTPTRAGRLYRLDPDGSIRTVLENVGTSNGMGFTPDRRGFYHTDTRRREIRIFDYDARTGELANPRTFATVPDGQGRPDGLTVDRAGGVWSARWGGGCVVRYAPDGTEVLRVDLPAPIVSSLIFGGDSYEDLFITTAGGNDRKRNGPSAGALLKIRPPVVGVPEFPSRIRGSATRTGVAAP